MNEFETKARQLAHDWIIAVQRSADGTGEVLSPKEAAQKLIAQALKAEYACGVEDAANVTWYVGKGYTPRAQVIADEIRKLTPRKEDWEMAEVNNENILIGALKKIVNSRRRIHKDNETHIQSIVAIASRALEEYDRNNEEKEREKE